MRLLGTSGNASGLRSGRVRQQNSGTLESAMGEQKLRVNTQGHHRMVRAGSGSVVALPL